MRSKYISGSEVLDVLSIPIPYLIAAIKADSLTMLTSMGIRCYDLSHWQKTRDSKFRHKYLLEARSEAMRYDWDHKTLEEIIEHMTESDQICCNDYREIILP